MNPFEMFPGSGKFVRSDQTPSEVKPFNRAHTLLVRSLWQQLQAAFPEGFESLSSVDVGLRCRLSKEDILLIKRFVENKSGFPVPSTDSVNEIFSRFIEPVSKEIEPPHFEISYEYALVFVPLIIYLVYRKFGAIITTIMGIALFAAYELYMQAIAKRHALLNRLPSVPDHCLPHSKRSFMSRLFSWMSSRSSEDECIEYFKLTMTSPFAELRPDRIFLSILGDFVEVIASTAGESVGRFYHKLNSWAPFYIAFPLACLFIWLLVCVAASRGKSKPSRSRKLRNKSTLSLKHE